jgi:hypothetical protein
VVVGLAPAGEVPLIGGPLPLFGGNSDEAVPFGVPRVGVPGVDGVPRVEVVSGENGVGLSSGRSVTSSVPEASGLPVEFNGSVPRKIYLKGVSVSTTSTEARDAFRRPINKMMMIPKIENPPTRIGRRRSRSKEGRLSIKNQFCL